MHQNSPILSPLITPLLTNLQENLKINIEEDYEILSLIGQGSYGVVYKIVKKSSNIFYALKVIPVSNSFGSEVIITNALKEIGILSRCNHRNIIDIYGYEIKQNEICFVMDLMEDNLEKYISSVQPTPEFIEKVFFSILDALYYLYNNFKIIHRDIKPSNILIEAETKEIKLSDFGTIKGCKGILTATIAGTKTYISPEIYRSLMKDDNFEVTANFSKSDVWSLGMTILKLVKGEASQGFKNLCKEKMLLINFLAELEKEIPENILKIIKLTLVWEEEKRPDIIELKRICNLFQSAKDLKLSGQSNCSSFKN
jgi:serine/threonine protein kinase